MNLIPKAQLRFFITPFIGYLILAMFRFSFGVIIPEVMVEYNLTEARAGGLLTAFLFSIAVMVIFGGNISDRIGKKITMSIGATIISISIITGGFSFDYWTLVLIFSITGIGAGIFIAALYAFMGEAIPSLRGSLIGFTMGSFALGGFLGPLISTLLILKFGWRSPFHVIGAFSLLLTFFLWLNSRDEFHIKKTKADRRSYDFLKDKNIILLCIAFGIANFAFAAFTTWTPSYLIRIGNLSFSEAGFTFSLFSVTGAIGTSLFGILSDKINRKRSILISGILAFLLSLIYFSGIVKSTGLIVLTIIFGFVGYTFPNLIISTVQDLANSKSLGSVTGFTFSIGMLGGAIAPALAGFLISNYGFSLTLILLVSIFSLIYTIIASRAI